MQSLIRLFILITRFIGCLAITLTAGLAFQVQATTPIETCVLDLSGPVPWEKLPSQFNTTLGAEFGAALKQSPEIAKLKRKYADGAGLKFYDYSTEDGFITGWSLQMAFLSRALKQIFPRAEFAKESVKSNFKAIDIYDFIDSTEMKPNGQIDMQILKSTNPGIPGLNRAAVRLWMGLPQDFKIASVYLANGGLDVVDEVMENLSPRFDLILFSVQGAADQNLTTNQVFKVADFCKQTKLICIDSNEMPGSGLAAGQRHLIFNKTKARMPYVHAAADVAIVLGSGNFFEPLYAGTPVYFQADPRGSDKDRVFRLEAWKSSARVAMATGRGQTFRTPEDLKQLLSTKQKGPFTLPFVTKDAEGKTPIDRLAVAIDRSLGLNKNRL